MDNTAGVAVCTSVLCALVKQRAHINVTLYYTSGEKAGFTGLLAMIEQDPERLALETNQTIWFVVDCSDVSCSRIMGLDQWHRRYEVFQNVRTSGSLNQVELLPRTLKQCPLYAAAIRLEDLVSVYDPSTARLLYQAALEVRASLLRDKTKDERWELGKSVHVPSLGLSGVFLGGRCEATILLQLHDLLSYRGYRNLMPARVGALALPLLNYRNVSHTSVGKLQPEELHSHALTSAALILGSACELAREYRFGQRHAAGFRAHSLIKGAFGSDEAPANGEEYIKHLVKKTRAYLGQAQSATDMWIRDTGRGLVSGLTTPAQ